MAQPPIPRVGSLTWEAFHECCLHMVTLTATDIRTYLAGGGSVQVDRKANYAGVPDADVATTVDRQAQAKLVRLATQLLPAQVGWIGEEDGLRRPSTFDGYSVVVTFDPLDGTSRLLDIIEAGGRPAPGDVSVMLGVLVNGVAVGGYICDVATSAVYYRQPYAPTVNIMTVGGDVMRLSEMPRVRSLRAGTLLWHGTAALWASSLSS